jgi:hypothetical protein
MTDDTAGDFVQAEGFSNVAHLVARHAQNPVRQKRARENRLARCSWIVLRWSRPAEKNYQDRPIGSSGR